MRRRLFKTSPNRNEKHSNRSHTPAFGSHFGFVQQRQTNNPTSGGLKSDASLRHGTNQTADVSGNVSFRKDKFSVTVFGNHFQTAGYDLTPEIFGPTVAPYRNNTLQTRLSYAFSKRTKLSLSGRYFVENQDQAFLAGASPVSGLGKVNDWNLNPVLSHHFSEKFRVQARLYITRYRTDARLNYDNGQVYDETYFLQNFTRPEFQAEYYFDSRNTLTVGGGHISESVEATRYTDKKRFQTNYAFVQYEWQPTTRWNVTAGGLTRTAFTARSLAPSWPRSGKPPSRWWYAGRRALVSKPRFQAVVPQFYQCRGGL